ncbi:MAG: hypothetical protein ACXWT4_11190, partial [Methylobacter sp.]
TLLMLSDTFSRQGLTPNKLKSTVVLHIGQPVKIVVVEPDRVIVAEQSDQLKLELPGIFNWALEGLHRLLKNHCFTIPPSSVEEVENYKLSNNPVALFCKLHLKSSHQQVSPSKDGTLVQHVFFAFDAFCRSNKFKSLDIAIFGKQMSQLKINSVKSNNRSYYYVTIHRMEIYDNNPYGH